MATDEITRFDHKDPQTAASSRIRNLALIGEVLAAIGVVMLMVSATCTIYHATVDPLTIDKEILKELPDGVKGMITPATRWMSILFGLAPVLSGSFGLYFSWRLFRGYRHLEIFHRLAARRISNIGWCIFFIGPLHIFSTSATILTLTIFNALGERRMEVSIEDVDIFAAVFGLVMVVIGRVMYAAVEVAEDNKAII